MMRARPTGAGIPGRPGAAPQGNVPPQAPPAAPQAQAGPVGRPGARPGPSAAAQSQIVDISEPVQQQQPAAQQQPFRPGPQAGARPGSQPPAQPPAVVQPQQTQVSTNTMQPGTLAALNPMLAGLDGMGENNRVSLTPAGFEYKATQEFVQELNIVIHQGVKLWQYWAPEEEGGGLCQSYDHKFSTDGLACSTCPHFKDKSCKFKFEVRWNEPDEDAESGERENIWTMSTVSAVTFVDYLKDLATKLGVGSHQVNTRVNFEIKRNGNNVYPSATYTPTHWYDAETGNYTEIPANQQFTTKNKK